MKKDFYSDIRSSERIMLEKGLYGLSNLQHRVDSFTQPKTLIARKRQTQQLLHPLNSPTPNLHNHKSPLGQLAHDLTKPFAHSSRPQPIAVIRHFQSFSSTLEQNLNQVMLKFLKKFKNQHQDEGDLKLTIEMINTEKMLEQQNNGISTRSLEVTSQIIQTLLKRFPKMINFLKQQGNYNRVKEIDEASNVIELLVSKDSQTGMFKYPHEIKQLTYFVNKIQHCINGVAQCEKGPIFLHYWPNISTVNALIHPILIAIHSLIAQQILVQQKKNKDRPQKMITNECAFEQLGDHRCSKVTFINLDGRQSPFNLVMAKELNKYLQYISFPIDSSFSLTEQFLLRDLTQSDIKHFSKIFPIKDKSPQEMAEYFKQLLVFPLYSQRLIQELELPNISPYYSSFIWFLIKEIVLNQIKQFNPSVIIVSYSGGITIKPHHFQAIIQELSVLVNMKIILYTNPTVNFKQEQPQKPLAQRQNWWLHQEAWQSLGLRNELIDKISMFLKISAGTFSFSHFQNQEDEVRQTYDNYKCLKYAGKLLPLVSRNHPVLSKLKNRIGEYQRRALILDHHYRTIPLTHLSCFTQNLLAATWSLFINLQSPYTSIITSLTQQYGIHLKEHWQAYVNRLALTQSKVQQKSFIKYFTRLTPIEQDQQSPYDLIALEFQIQSRPGTPLLLTSSSEILISKEAKGPFVLVFILNHLASQNSKTLSNYAGFVGERMESRVEDRVMLREIKFHQQLQQLNQFQSLSQFNYYQTREHVILFWPVLYDHKLATLHSFAGTTYKPNPVPLFFMAPKSNPFDMVNIKLMSQTNTIPKTGCTCFKPSHSDTIFIFGGFYNSPLDYLTLQTEVSLLQITSPGQVSLNTLPRHFYFQQQHLPNSSASFVSNLSNDFVRPKIQYQIYLKHQRENSSQIILFGGVGQKYLQPYSLLTHTGHLISFQNNIITKISRIKLNNIVPSSLLRPFKLKTGQEIQTFSHAQNRRIGSRSCVLSSHSSTILSLSYRYDQAEERMTFTKNYEIGLQSYEKGFEASPHEGQRLKYIQRFSKLTVNFQLLLDKQQAQLFINLKGAVVTLAQDDVIAVEHHAKQIYAIVHHPVYTCGHSILVRSSSIDYQRIVDHSLTVWLREIYCFDQQIKKCSLKVQEGGSITILPNNQQFEKITILKSRDGFYYKQQGQQTTIE